MPSNSIMYFCARHFRFGLCERQPRPAERAKRVVRLLLRWMDTGGRVQGVETGGGSGAGRASRGRRFGDPDRFTLCWRVQARSAYQTLPGMLSHR